MAAGLGDVDRLEPEVLLRIGGFSTKASAERMLALAEASRPDLPAMLSGPGIAPALGGFSVSYDLLATLGILSFPAGMIASYLASVIFAYFHGGEAKDERVQVILVRDAVRVFVFVDRGTEEAVIEKEVAELLERVRPDDDAG